MAVFDDDAFICSFTNKKSPMQHNLFMIHTSGEKKKIEDKLLQQIFSPEAHGEVDRRAAIFAARGLRRGALSSVVPPSLLSCSFTPSLLLPALRSHPR
jgi:hypothetical protein